MNDKTENQTAGKIAFSETANSVTVTISGRAFENLKEIAAIFNKWDGADNSPADVVRKFLCSSDDWAYLDEKKPDSALNPQTLPGMICDCYSEETDVQSLESAFEAAGFSTQR